METINIEMNLGAMSAEELRENRTWFHRRGWHNGADKFNDELEKRGLPSEFGGD